jgi:RNA polymerase sigma factor (sigma-70 family)
MDRTEVLYHEHIGRAVRLAYLLTGDKHKAEDIAHDAFLRCATRSNSLRAADKFAPYLAKTIVRETIDRSRSTARRLTREQVYVGSSRPGPPVSMEDEVASRLQIMAALDGLPGPQRAAVVFRYWLGYSEPEIAAAVGCSTGTVKSRLARARESLRGALNE